MDKEHQAYNAKRYPSRSVLGWKALAVITTIISIISLAIAVAALVLVLVQMWPISNATTNNISQREVMQVSYTPTGTQRKAEVLKNASWHIFP